MLNQGNYVVWIDTDFLSTEKQIIFINTLQKILKQDLTLQTMNQTKHCQKERDGVSRKTLKELATLAAKPHSYLIDYNSVMKRILKFEDYKSCLKAIELENKMNQIKKNEVNIDSLKKDHSIQQKPMCMKRAKT